MKRVAVDCFYGRSSFVVRSLIVRNLARVLICDPSRNRKMALSLKDMRPLVVHCDTDYIRAAFAVGELFPRPSVVRAFPLLIVKPSLNFRSDASRLLRCAHCII